jgi:hypothetical protein
MRMDSKQLEQLLEKYWNCETSLEEEKQLRDYFQGEVPENLRETAGLFRYFEEQQLKSVGGSDFDETVIKKIKQHKPEGRSVKMIFNYARIAAGLIVVVTATYFVRLEVRKAYPPEIVDTYSDPKLALEETKKALMMISKGFNKAQKEAGKIKVFNEAEEKLQKQQKSEGTI